MGKIRRKIYCKKVFIFFVFDLKNVKKEKQKICEKQRRTRRKIFFDVEILFYLKFFHKEIEDF